MKVFRVIGVYDRTKFMERFINAHDEVEALERFRMAVNKKDPLVWERMGDENVFLKHWQMVTV